MFRDSLTEKLALGNDIDYTAQTISIIKKFDNFKHNASINYSFKMHDSASGLNALNMYLEGFMAITIYYLGNKPCLVSETNAPSLNPSSAPDDDLTRINPVLENSYPHNAFEYSAFSSFPCSSPSVCLFVIDHFASTTPFMLYDKNGSNLDAALQKFIGEYMSHFGQLDENFRKKIPIQNIYNIRATFQEGAPKLKKAYFEYITNLNLMSG